MYIDTTNRIKGKLQAVSPSKCHQLSGTFPYKQVLVLEGKMKLAKKKNRNYHNTHGDVRQLIEERRVIVHMRSEKGKPV